MKKTLTLVALFSLFSVVAGQVSIGDSHHWQKSIQAYLNQKDIVVYNLKVVDGNLIRSISFSYDIELVSDPGYDTTFQCTGTADKETFTVFNLDCEEDEPILWDEFQ